MFRNNYKEIIKNNEKTINGVYFFLGQNGIINSEMPLYALISDIDAFLFGVVLSDAKQTNGHCRLSVREISAISGIGRNTVSRSMQKMDKIGIISYHSCFNISKGTKKSFIFVFSANKANIQISVELKNKIKSVLLKKGFIFQPKKVKKFDYKKDNFKISKPINNKQTKKDTNKELIYKKTEEIQIEEIFHDPSLLMDNSIPRQDYLPLDKDINESQINEWANNFYKKHGLKNLQTFNVSLFPNQSKISDLAQSILSKKIEEIINQNKENEQFRV